MNIFDNIYQPKSSIATNSGSKRFFQPKLTINTPGDPYEQQADAMAEQVMRMKDPFIQPKPFITIQRKCAHCEEEEKNMQRKDNGQGETKEQDGFENYINNLQSSGQPMPAEVRNFYEPRFGYDFSSVKLHTDSMAAKSAQSINALAYTSGNNIVFNNGQYSPESESGKKLLAHELTHIVQQKAGRKMIQRACDPQDLPQYDKIAAQIPQLSLFQNVPVHADAIHTPQETRTMANDVITQARSRDDCLYYIRQLHLLFSTNESPPANIAAIWGPRLADAAQAEQARLGTPQGQQNANFEETLSANPARQWTPHTGQGGKIYNVDSTSLSNIVVKVKIKLSGQQQLVNQAKALEDGIEKRASRLGYTIDVEFVNSTGADVFEANVDTSQWPTSGNFSGDVEVMTHEVHHLLNLPDRYNYIESHSGNQEMYVANRIHWFVEEFNRPPDPNRFISFMGEGNLVTDIDICTVIQSGNVASCITQRQALRSTALTTKLRAGNKAQRVKEVLTGIIPVTLLDPRADPTTLPLAQDRIRRTAANIFGQAISDSDIETALDRMRWNLFSGQINMENVTDPQCQNDTIAIMNQPPTFIICPAFPGLAQDVQEREFIRMSYRMYQEFSTTGVRLRMLGNPMDPADAVKWAEFVVTAYNRI